MILLVYKHVKQKGSFPRRWAGEVCHTTGCSLSAKYRAYCLQLSCQLKATGKFFVYENLPPQLILHRLLSHAALVTTNGAPDPASYIRSLIETRKYSFGEVRVEIDNGATMQVFDENLQLWIFQGLISRRKYE